MRIHEPIKNYIHTKHPQGSVTQWFGENKVLYSRWGLDGHNGIDIVAPHGTPLLAVEDGIIVSVKLSPDGFGKHVRLRSTKKYQGKYRCWVYGHCSEILVTEKQKVKAGDTIALMGNTGFVVSGANPWWKTNPYAGTHLHLGMRYLIPDEKGWKYPGDTIRYEVDNYDNGVKGAVNFQFLLEPEVPQVNKDMWQQLLTIQSIINSLKVKFGVK